MRFDNFDESLSILYLGHISGIIMSRLVIKIVVIASPSASNVSFFCVFRYLNELVREVVKKNGHFMRLSHFIT